MSTGWGVLAMIAMAMMAAPAQAQTPAPMPAQTALQDSAPHYVVTIVETGAPDAEKATAILRDLAAASREETGNAGYSVLHQRGHTGRFAILETWRDKSALDRHDAAAKAAEEKLQPLLVAPLDRRVCDRARCRRPAGRRCRGQKSMSWTHVDVVPPKKDEAIALLNELAGASRKDGGVYRFDVWQQASRPNHSYVVEAWRDDAARNAHVMADHTRAYRAELLPARRLPLRRAHLRPYSVSRYRSVQADHGTHGPHPRIRARPRRPSTARPRVPDLTDWPHEHPQGAAAVRPHRPRCARATRSAPARCGWPSPPSPTRRSRARSTAS